MTHSKRHVYQSLKIFYCWCLSALNHKHGRWSCINRSDGPNHQIAQRIEWKWFSEDEVNEPLSKFISCIMFYVSPQHTHKSKKIHENYMSIYIEEEQKKTTHFHFELKANQTKRNSIYKSVSDRKSTNVLKWDSHRTYLYFRF